ncbi:MAG TPA: Ig-like domain-containing protein [Pyrinomonadaceae bacterium]|nr:Ig-like domain-containing protein [Pyrinomonadaceae bacterium]
MVTKSNRFAFDWWVVQKRAVYLIVAVFLLSGIAAGGALYVWKYGNPLKNVGTELKISAGARFISFEGEVRVIRAATRETIPASSDTQLYPGDTVQTQASGRARVAMADGSTLVVRPNSTITIRDNASVENGKKSTVHVVVDSGQINVRTEQQPEGTTNLVETPKTQTRMGTQTGASFGVNPEGTEEIRVNTGIIETTNRAGEKTAVHGGEYISVNPSGTISKPQRLLEVPAPSEPGDLERVVVNQNGSANIALKWLRPHSGTAAYYRVEVATSPFFVTDGKVIERDQLASTEFTASDLRPGVYFWRVRATAATGQTSDWSEPLKFMVIARGTGSQVPVTELTAELLGGNVYIIRGRAEPGTTIRVAGRETLTATDGTFQIQITSPSGGNQVAVEAQDARGNSSQYRVQLSPRRGRT